MSNPTNIVELKAARVTAGERYAAAITELEASYIELAAYDRALQNRNVNIDAEDIRTFRGDLNFFPIEMQHPDFGSYTTEFQARVTAEAAPLIAALSN